MPLIPCLECGQQISTRAAACPHCGAPLAAPTNKAATAGWPAWRWLVCFLGILILVVSAWQGFHHPVQGPMNVGGATNLSGSGGGRQLPQIEADSSLAGMGVTFREWRWLNPPPFQNDIIGQVMATNAWIDTNGFTYVVYGRKGEKLREQGVICPSLRPGEIGSIQIQCWDYEQASRIVISRR